jgi:fructokinase
MAHTRKEPRMIPVIFGEVLFDCFPDGEAVLGGAPFNVAWHLQAFGDEPCFISRIGDDVYAAQIKRAMRRWGMVEIGVQQDTVYATGQVIVSIEEGEPHYEIRADVAYDFIDVTSLPQFDRPALLYHGTLALRNPASRHALDELERRGDFSVFLDVNLRPPWWNKATVLDYLHRARWAKLNEHELAMLSDAGDGIQARAEQLLKDCNLELLVVTQGAKGAVAYGDDGTVASVAPAAATRVVDTVGAGDAFTSVLLHGILNHWPLQQSLDAAQRFASAVVGIRGAVPSDEQFYRDNSLRLSRELPD